MIEDNKEIMIQRIINQCYLDLITIGITYPAGTVLLTARDMAKLRAKWNIKIIGGIEDAKEN